MTLSKSRPASFAAMAAMFIQWAPGLIFLNPMDMCPALATAKGLQSQKPAMANCSGDGFLETSYTSFASAKNEELLSLLKATGGTGTNWSQESITNVLIVFQLGSTASI